MKVPNKATKLICNLQIYHSWANGEYYITYTRQTFISQITSSWFINVLVVAISVAILNCVLSPFNQKQMTFNLKSVLRKGLCFSIDLAIKLISMQQTTVIYFRNFIRQWTILAVTLYTLINRPKSKLICSWLLFKFAIIIFIDKSDACK